MHGSKSEPPSETIRAMKEALWPADSDVSLDDAFDDTARWQEVHRIAVAAERATLRDQFAGQAVIGYAGKGYSYRELADHAYCVADAMLAERSKADG